MSLAPGPDLEGSRTVASSTPVRISVPLTEAPGRPDLSSVDVIGGQAKWEQAEAKPGAGGDSRRRARAGHRAGRRDRCGQGVGQGVCAGAAGRLRVGGSAGCGTWRRRTGAITELAEQLVGAGHREGHRRVDIGLLADLVLPAGGGRAGGAAGQRPRREERARAGRKPTSSTRSGWPS